MENKFEFDFFQNINNSKIFKYPNNINKTSKGLDRWSKLELNLQKNRTENYFTNDSISTLNIGSIKSIEWEDMKYFQDHKNNNFDSSLNVDNKNIKSDLDLETLEKLIHPIDDEFEVFIQRKIEDLEKLKTKNDKKIGNKKNINTNTYTNINDDNIKTKNINNNENFLQEKNYEKTIIKEKNKPIFTFNKIESENNEFDNNKMKSFLDDYNSNENNTNNSNLILNNYRKNESNIGNRNKKRLFNLLSRIKNDKKETEIINKPNKFKIFDNSEENSNLNKIQRRYYNQFRKEDKFKDKNINSKDYFSTIIYDLNKEK